jgi:hypothetical protein
MENFKPPHNSQEAVTVPENEVKQEKIISAQTPEEELQSMRNRIAYLAKIKDDSPEYKKKLEESMRLEYYKKYPEFIDALTKLKEEPTGLFFNVEDELKSLKSVVPENSEEYRLAESVEESEHHERFKMNIERLRKSLEGAKEVETYGTKRAQLASHRNVLLDSLVWEKPHDFFEVSNNKTDNFVVICRDEADGKILGMRLSTVTDVDEKDHSGFGFTAKGFVIVNTRGEGVATAIERAYEAMLQDMVTEKQHQFEKIGSSYKPGAHVRIVAENKNVEDLLKLKAELAYAQADGADEDTLSQIKGKIKRKEVEQKRWLEVYGDHGKMGMTKSDEGSKYYIPGKEYMRQKYEKVIRPSGGLFVEKTPMPEEGLDSIKASIRKAAAE